MLSCRVVFHPFTFLLLAVTAGCGQEPTKNLDVATADEALIGGTLDFGHPSVGFLGANACTATLIGSKTLLLAAHCVEPGEIVGFCSISGDRPGVCTSGASGFGIAVRNPNFATSWTDSHDFGDDIAIVKLNQPFPGTPSPISAGNQDTPGPGRAVILVGTGCTDAATKAGVGPKRSGGTTIADVPGDNTFTTNGPPTSCSGDSGGAVFMNSGENCQIGVMVGVSGSTSINTRVDTKLSWILAEANDPTIQTCSSSTCLLSGSRCDINGDCCSGSCHCTFACGTAHPVSACQ